MSVNKSAVILGLVLGAFTFHSRLGVGAPETSHPIQLDGKQGVPLQPYLDTGKLPNEVLGGFWLVFEGKLRHVLVFDVRASKTLDIHYQLVFPGGSTRSEHQLLPASDRPQRLSFSLGPLLGHGPYRYRPNHFYPGEYLLTVEGRDADRQNQVFISTFRLPPQEWIGADLTRLLYIDDTEAGLDIRLLPGALVNELPGVVDLIEPSSGQIKAAPRRVVLRYRDTRVTFDLRGLSPGIYRARVRPEVDGKIWPDGIERTLQLFRNGPAPRVTGSSRIGDGPQLFVDDYLVDKARGLTTIFHPARKASDQPVLSPDRPYEGHAVIASVPPTYKADRKRYEMIYENVGYAYGNVRYEMLAVSEDLNVWTKPDVGRVEVDGSRHNNILKVIDETRADSVAENFEGIWDYATGGNPDLRTARFWMLTSGVTNDQWHLRRGFYLIVRDADGKSYVTTPTPILFLSEGGTETMSASGDNVASLGGGFNGASFGYDEDTGEYVVYTSPGPPNAGRGWVRYDNATKARTLARHATRDGINWEARYIWVPEVTDPNIHNYGFRVRRVGDTYLGFFPRYNVRTQRMDLQLWVSRDGIHWEQPGGQQAWLANGPAGRFDGGIVYMPLGWYEEGDRTRIFYHGANYLHFHAWVREKLARGVKAEHILTEDAYNGRAYLAPPSTKGLSWSLVESGWSWRRGVFGTVAEAKKKFWAELTAETGETPGSYIQRSRDFKIFIGLAEFRANGFVSRKAGATEGVLTTHPLLFEGSQLTVNADVHEGSLDVEVLDERGSPIPGFTRAECILAPFDSTRQPVRWKNESHLARLRNRPVRLRFYLRRGDLYGFQIHNAGRQSPLR